MSAMATVVVLLLMGAGPAPAIAELRRVQAGGVDPGMGETVDAPPGPPAADAGSGSDAGSRSGLGSETGVSTADLPTSTAGGGRGAPAGDTGVTGLDGPSTSESAGAVQSPLLLLMGLGMIFGGGVYLILHNRHRADQDKAEAAASISGT